jgi:hypothetical protein
MLCDFCDSGFIIPKFFFFDKVPADLNAQLAKLKLLHLFAAPPTWAKNAEPTQP